MDGLRFSDLKRSVGFDDYDAAKVKSLARRAETIIPHVVDRFYDRILDDPNTRAVLGGNDGLVDRLRVKLAQWLRDLFEGRYEQDYFDARFQIGQTHVMVGLPQHYMLTAMDWIWWDLENDLRGEDGGDKLDDALPSLHKLLMLDLAIMLESYKEAYAEQVRKSERRAVEEILTQAEHLAEIGQLAASLAHEIKNPLAGISGAIQIMRDAMPDDNPHRPILSEILGQIKRLDATVKDLLLYARPTPPRLTVFHVGNAITRVLSVLREEPSMQRVRIQYAGSPPNATVRADDAQIEHLLINLILNSAHASADGGVIYLRVGSNSTHVRLTVKDAGTGMAPEVRDQAFEAFFTTKAKGTGLGLSICRRIVEAHRGKIGLESKLGRGTTVTVDLPRRGVVESLGAQS